jgi:hypothetical protein
VGAEIAGAGAGGRDTEARDSFSVHRTEIAGYSSENSATNDYVMSLPGINDEAFQIWFDAETRPASDPGMIVHNTYLENPFQLNCAGFAFGKGNLIMPLPGHTASEMIREMGWSQVAQFTGRDVPTSMINKGDIISNIHGGKGSMDTRMNDTFSNVDVHGRRVTSSAFGIVMGEEIPGSGFKPGYGSPQHPGIRRGTLSFKEGVEYRVWRRR